MRCKRLLSVALLLSFFLCVVSGALAREYYLTGDCKKDCMAASYLACLDDCRNCSGSRCDYDKCEDACKRQVGLCLKGCPDNSASQ